MTPDLTHSPIQPLRFWEHWAATQQAFRDYAPGTDVVFDRLRSASPPVRVAVRFLLGPLYLARGQGWTIRDEHGDRAALLYLRRHDRQGVRVLHVDNIEVDARYRRMGLAHRLLLFTEILARREGYGFLSLAVSVANTSATALYRRLGYQEHHHRLFIPHAAWTTAPLLDVPMSPALRLRPLDEVTAGDIAHTIYRAEVRQSDPALADLLLAHYPLALPPTHCSRKLKRYMYAIEEAGVVVGYCDIDFCSTPNHARFGMRCDFWDSPSERAALVTLFVELRRSGCADFSLKIMSAAHHTALCNGELSLAEVFSLQDTTTERMVMMKGIETL